MMKRKRKKSVGIGKSCLLGMILLGALLLVACLIIYFWDGEQELSWVDNPDGIGVLRSIEYDGQVYQEKKNQTSLLLMGIDRGENAAVYGARKGGQADFIMLVVLDHDAKRIRRLQLDRDTMTNVTTLGVLGNPTGTRVMQLCLSHGFGDGEKQSCSFTVEAVENMLQGIEIDGYYALEIDGIGELNAALGGVTVKLEDDFSGLDPEMTLGRTLTLNETQAELFVRGRTEVGDGTNAARMQRQRVYLEAATEQFRQKIKESSKYINDFLNVLDGIATTDLTRGHIVNEVNRAYMYDVLPVETLAGEYKIGEDGFVEFHASESETTQWVLQNFYHRK